MSLTHTFQQREAPNSEKVLRRILHQDEIWYWDPNSNEIEKLTRKQIKKEQKREKKERAKTEKRHRKEQEKTEKNMKKGRRAEPSASRKALATSDDACWRKAEINRKLTKSDEITLGNPTEAIEQTLGIRFVDKNKSKAKSHALHQSLSLPRVFKKSKGTQSACSASSSSSSEDDTDSDDSTRTVPQTIKKLRLVLRHGTKSSSSSHSTSTISSTTTTTTTSFFDSSTLSGSACSSPTSSATNTPISSPRPMSDGASSPMTSPRSPTSDTTISPATSPRLPTSSPRLTTSSPRPPTSDSPMNSPRLFTNTPVGPAVSPRANRVTRVQLDAGLRRSLQTGHVSPIGQAYSPRSGPSDSTSPRTDSSEHSTSSPITPRARCPTPLALEQEQDEEEEPVSDDELELQSIAELTDDSADEEGTGFWVRERMHRTPSSRIPATPYFDLILRSFDDCL